MKLNKRGESGLRVSEICLGSMIRGEQNSERDAHLQLDFALDRGLSLAEMALAFVRTHWFVASTIVGATDLVQLKQNIGSVKVELDAETLAGIDAIHRRYPSPAA